MPIGVYKRNSIHEPKRACALCLYSLGLGGKRVSKLLYIPHKRVVIQFAREAGIFDPNRRPIGHQARDVEGEQLCRAGKEIVRLARKIEREKAAETMAVTRMREREDLDRTRLERLSTKKLKVRLRTFVWKLVAQPDVGQACGGNGQCKRAHRKCRDCFARWLIGCSPAAFRAHLSDHLELGMSFNNYGAWEIDHRSPCKSFDLRKESDLRRCFHHTNLRPMWMGENRRKSAKVAVARNRGG